MTESAMESRGLPSVNGTAQQPVSAPKTKLNPAAKSFVFSVNAPVWTPPSAAMAPPPTPPKPVLSAPVTPVKSTPVTPVKASVLKPSAREFIPSAFAAPFVPSFAVVPSPPLPPKSASPAKTAAVDDEPAITDASSSSSTHAEPESEEQGGVADDEPEKDAVEAPKAAEPVAEVELNPVTEPEPVAVEQSPVVEKPVETEEMTAAEQPQTDVVAAHIIYTIAQLLEMEPPQTPMPASVVGTQVAAVKGKDDADGPASGKPSRKEGRSSRSLSRSNSSFNEGRGRGGRGRGGRGGRGPPQPEIALEDVAPLETNEETRWKPSHSKSRLDAPADTTEASLKEAKSILNKLSIEKFDKLSDQLIEVAVRSIDVLNGVIDMVISKAQMEWHFSTMYASLCSKIAQTEMPAMALDDEEGPQDTHKLFRKLLLTQCQKEFEVAPSREGFDELPEDERLEKELLLKRGVLGHIRFVGELFKQRMLSSRIMHACVQRLFGDVNNPDEESLECLCKLLGTIGQKFEGEARDPGEQSAIANYYAVIKQLAGDSEKLCTRVRFMLQDLLELRKNKWVARRQETKAMTIAEVHAEAAREAKEKAKASGGPPSSNGSSRGLTRSMSSSSMSSTGSDRRRKDSGGAASAAWKARAASVSATPSVDADGWETVTGGRPKLSKSRSSAALPVGDRPAPRHPTFGRNRSESASRNSFSMLQSEGRAKETSGRERSFSSSAAMRRVSSSDKPPRPGSSSTPSSPVKNESTEKKSGPVSVDVFKKKAKSIFEEFVELQDLDEAVTCLKELNSSVHHGLIIDQTLNIGLEKGAKQRSAAGKLLAGLYERELLDKQVFASSVRAQLEFAEDMEIDIPLTLNYLAEMLAPSVAIGAVSSSEIVKSLEPLTSSGKAAKFMALLLVAINNQTVAKEFVQGVDMASLLRDGERSDEGVKALYAQHSLEFLL